MIRIGRLYEVRKAFDAMTGRRTLVDEFAGCEVEALAIKGASEVECETKGGKIVFLHPDRLVPISGG